MFGTELVTLSACQTALGEDAGSEGLASLGMAFRLAGARNVLMSQWKVSDDGTREFMTALYETWFEARKAHPDQSSSESLRRALKTTMLTLKNAGAQPQVFGAFVLMEN